MTLREGDHFNHYEICAHGAQGGLGDVYRARDLLTGKEVALKIPYRSVILDASFYEQFLREVEAMHTLQHPALQHGIESGRYQDTPFLVTEWINGPSLRHLIEETGVFPVDRALRLTRRIAAALVYCHEQGFVHRDLKPENVLLRDEEQPVIIDFGLALTPERPGPGKTAGTPDYVAPEQIEGERGDQRIDIYSLGTLLYELLAGQLPFVSQDTVEIMNMHLYNAVPRLDRVQPEVSVQLATVVARCMQRNPERRYTNMQDLIADLDDLDRVDTSQLDKLLARPPRPPFLRTQAGQVILMLTAFVVGTTLLTLAAVALKH